MQQMILLMEVQLQQCVILVVIQKVEPVGIFICLYANGIVLDQHLVPANKRRRACLCSSRFRKYT